MIITEHELDTFRAEALAPDAILNEVERSVNVLYRLGVGVGKSVAADRLLSYPGTFRRFDLVVYAAPSWSILNERSFVSDPNRSPVASMILRPRPVDDCAQYAEAWAALEKRGCAAYGKATLCRECQATTSKRKPCFWPEQYSHLEGIQLIFATEQQIVLNRSLIPMLKSRTKSGRTLVILDEARLLDTSFEISLAPRELEHFCEAVRHLLRPKGISKNTAHAWIRSMEFLANANSAEILDARLDFPARLNRNAYLLQSEGIRMFGTEFKYLGYDLALLQWSRQGERWKDEGGTIRFMARPYLNCHLLILSAHLTAPYTAHRLGKSSTASPFEHVRFRHSSTRILNLRNRMGADAYFKRNHTQILDFFATLIARNIAENRSTLLVSRRKSKGLCTNYLEKRLAGWGVKVEFVHDEYHSLPKAPDPSVIPVIHYGMLGVNDFTEYESAYCLNSYYVSTTELNRHVQDAEPEEFRIRLKIVSGPEMLRRVEIEERGTPDLDHTTLGNIYLRKLEVDPVIQATGRVRFLTRPREVVFFQMHDLTPDVGVCEDFRTLAALREALAIPRARDIDELLEARRIESLALQGLTAAGVAAQMGISRRTLFRRLQTAESAKFPYSIFIRKFGTLPAPPPALEVDCE